MKYILVLLVILGLLSFAVALAAPQAFSLPWWTVDSGGGASQGGGYKLTGTTGQSEAGTLLSGDAYTLAGGFWGAGAPYAGIELFLPIVTR
jgi:hypothetical protein